MNKEIELFYLDRIDDDQLPGDFIREALITGIRCDNAELVKRQREKNSFREASMAILHHWNLPLMRWLHMK